MMIDQIFTAFGVLGGSLCVLAYFLLELGKLRDSSPAFYLINGMGAFFVIIGITHSFDGGDAGALFQETCWIAISAMGFVKAVRKKDTPPQE